MFGPERIIMIIIIIKTAERQHTANQHELRGKVGEKSLFTPCPLGDRVQP